VTAGWLRRAALAIAITAQRPDGSVPVEGTASAPVTARSMAAASVISPVTTVTSCPQGLGTLPGVRT
jgi:hypothetical protein